MQKDKLKIIEQKHLFSKDFKIKFLGDGEWIEEPDYIKFNYKRYKGMIYRIINEEIYAKEEAYFGGYLCGYIIVPKNHPFFCQFEICYENIYCHGGITFNKFKDDVHLIGFACAHLGDYIPACEHMKKTIPEMIEIEKAFPLPEGMEDYLWLKPIYKNLNYCIEECKNIINQLVEENKNAHS
jgi:hypothetical protein